MKSIKKYFSFLLIIFLFFSTNKDVYSKAVNKIIVKIDGNIITSLDLQNDVAIFLYLNNLELNKKNINSSKERVLKNLIDRKIKINEINKNNVERYSALDVSTFIAKIAQGKNLTFKEFKSEFKKRGIDYLAFENSIKVEFLWNSLIFDLFANQVLIDPKDLEQELQKALNNTKVRKKYNLSEIVFNNINDTDIKNIFNHIQEKGFIDAVSKFSSSQSSINKGEIGWVNDYELNPNYLKELDGGKIGYITKPIQALDKFVILRINDIKIDKDKKLDKKQIKAGIIDSMKKRKLNFFALSHFQKIQNSALISFK